MSRECGGRGWGVGGKGVIMEVTRVSCGVGFWGYTVCKTGDLMRTENVRQFLPACKWIGWMF